MLKFILNKKCVPAAVLEPIDKELERLEELGVISKVVYFELAVLKVYVKKNNEIRV